ncbi:MAG: radical SAM protein [bacterium]
MKILLLTPPLVQLNTPYPATPTLAGFLHNQGEDVAQADLSLELTLRLFSREGLRQIAEACRTQAKPTPRVCFFLETLDAYLNTVETAVSFLQGRNEAAGWLIARRNYLPEGPRFAALDPEGTGADEEDVLAALFGTLGVADRAKHLASLYLDDLADIIAEGVDPAFGFACYAERIAVSASTFDPILKRLAAPPTLTDHLIDSLTEETLKKHAPDIVGLTLPFPGTVYAAFRIAAAVRRLAPATRIVMGGGYVNTELRHLTDPRVFGFVDFLCFDEGFTPWLGILGKAPLIRTASVGHLPSSVLCPPSFQLPTADRRLPIAVPSYSGFDLSQYMSLLEMANPLHRIWSDGKWIKLQLANGCYWHQCAFCDVALDYIRRCELPDVKALVDTLIRLKGETGQTGFHFTDEALAPALIRQLCKELLARGETITWWGNVRFDRSFTPGLARLMAQAGCIAVSGGLECAHDRLLKLMCKGITLASAAQACQAFSDAGILVHAYLMYGFPTQTEQETLDALEYVRQRFTEGHIQSAYWHRFALTAHSPIAQNPERYGLVLSPQPEPPRRFALNEIPYEETGAPDHARLGTGLRLALYNYMLGLGLDAPVKTWFDSRKRKLS